MAGKLTFERFVDLLVIFTAIGMTFLIVFAMLTSAQRTTELSKQVKINQQTLELLEAVQQSIRRGTEKHSESALAQHCAEAQISAMADGKVTKNEAALLTIACRG